MLRRDYSDSLYRVSTASKTSLVKAMHILTCCCAEERVIKPLEFWEMYAYNSITTQFGDITIWLGLYLQDATFRVDIYVDYISTRIVFPGIN